MYGIPHNGKIAVLTIILSFLDCAKSDASFGGKYCYICDSSTSYDCFDPDYETHAEVCQYGCQLLINTTTPGGESVSVIRSCGPWEAQYDEGCKRNTIDSYSLEECMCRTDYCNNNEAIPGTAFEMTKCYNCDFYGTGSTAVDTNNCLSPDVYSTPLTACPYGHCKKVFYTNGDSKGVGRQCVDKVEYNELNCETDSSDYTICHCEGHLCNHGNIVTTQPIIILVVGLTLLIRHFT